MREGCQYCTARSARKACKGGHVAHAEPGASTRLDVRNGTFARTSGRFQQETMPSSEATSHIIANSAFVAAFEPGEENLLVHAPAVLAVRPLYCYTQSLLYALTHALPGTIFVEALTGMRCVCDLFVCRQAPPT